MTPPPVAREFEPASPTFDPDAPAKAGDVLAIGHQLRLVELEVANVKSGLEGVKLEVAEMKGVVGGLKTAMDNAFGLVGQMVGHPSETLTAQFKLGGQRMQTVVKCVEALRDVALSKTGFVIALIGLALAVPGGMTARDVLSVWMGGPAGASESVSLPNENGAVEASTDNLDTDAIPAPTPVPGTPASSEESAP
jgi:hypothetical protein